MAHSWAAAINKTWSKGSTTSSAEPKQQEASSSRVMSGKDGANRTWKLYPTTEKEQRRCDRTGGRTRRRSSLLQRAPGLCGNLLLCWCVPLRPGLRFKPNILSPGSVSNKTCLLINPSASAGILTVAFGLDSSHLANAVFATIVPTLTTLTNTAGVLITFWIKHVGFFLEPGSQVANKCIVWQPDQHHYLWSFPNLNMGAIKHHVEFTSALHCENIFVLILFLVHLK